MLPSPNGPAQGKCLHNRRDGCQGLTGDSASLNCSALTPLAGLLSYDYERICKFHRQGHGSRGGRGDQPERCPGEIGELIYCGYNINDLAEKATFEEVVHLLHRGHLPDADELSALKAEFCTSRNLPGGVIDVLKALPKDTSPMHALRTGVSALGCFDSEAETQDDLEAVRKNPFRSSRKCR